FRYEEVGANAFSSQLALDGANQTWVFNVSSQSTSLVEYKSSSKTPYAFYFFNTVGQKIADNIGLGQYELQDVYEFYSTSNASYRIEGLGFKISLAPLPLAGNYQLEDKMYVFPLEYGHRDSNQYKVSISIPLIGSYTQS